MSPVPTPAPTPGHLALQVTVQLSVLDVAVLLANWRMDQPADAPLPRLGQVRTICQQALDRNGTVVHTAGRTPPRWALQLASRALDHGTEHSPRASTRSQNNQAGPYPDGWQHLPSHHLDALDGMTSTNQP